MIKNLMKKFALVGAISTLVVSSVSAAVTVTASPSTVVVPVDGAVQVTLNNSGNTAVSSGNLKIGSTQSTSGAGQTYSTTYYSASLSATSIAKSGGTVTLTITGLRANSNSQTLQVYNGTTKLTTVAISKVIAATGTYEVNLCVGDKVLFGQRPSNTTYYWQNSTLDATIASVDGTTMSTTSATANKDATITANKTGTANIVVGWYTRGGSRDSYTYTLTGFNLYKVTVGAARSVEVEKTVDATCVTPKTGANWTSSSASSSTASVTLSTTSSSVSSTTATITGVAAGKTTVTVSDYRTGNSYNYGATYTLAVEVTKKTESKTSTAPAMTTADSPATFQLEEDKAFSADVSWNATATSGNANIATATVSGGATKRPTMTITPVGVGTTTLTAKNSSDTGKYDFTWTVSVTVSKATKCTYKGYEISFPGADFKRSGDSETITLTYTAGSGNSLVIPADATATVDYLVVGGGGSGGRGSNTSTYYASGNGGEVKHGEDVPFAEGTYAISVGQGGAAVTQNNTAGNAGNDSYLRGPDFSETAKGAEAATGKSSAAGSPTTGTKSSISGTEIEYGKGAAAANQNSRGAAGVNPGDGGQGNCSGRSSGKGADGIVIVRLTNIEEAVTPLDGKEEINLGQGRTVTRTTEHEMTRYDITSGTCLESVSVSGTKLTITAKSDTVGQTAVVKFYDGSDTLIKVIKVTVTEAPDVIHFKGRDIEYQNAVVDDKSILGELLITFTDAAKTGRLIIPEDANAQILVVGGGAGGVSTYWKTSDMFNGYAGNGGAGGRVLEITAADNYTLPSGDYAITVGAGGVAVTDVPVKTTPYFYGDNPGGDSSFVGDGIELTAKGGVASPSNEQKPLQFIDVQEQPAIESGIKRDYREASFDGTKDYQAHNGTGAHGDRTGVTPGGDPDYDKTGYTSSITGSEQVYGVGGEGGWVVGNSDDWYTQVPGDDGTPGTGNGGGGASNGGDSGAGGCGCVIVRLAYKEIPQAKTFSASPIVAGDALSASVISFTMVDDVPGTWAWIAPETVPETSGEQVARFTPADQQSYSLLDTTIPVTVLTPQEPTDTVIATGSLDAESTTETAAELWNYVISSGAEFIGTPALVVNGDGTATLTVGGAAQGTAYVDLYTGSETAGAGTFCKRVIVAVLPDAPAGEDLSVEEGESVTSAAQESGAWTYAVQVGGTLISVASFDPANGQLALDGLKAGTAIVDLFESGELAVRVTVAVKGPTEGYESRVVGEGRSIDVKTAATVTKAVTKPAAQSAVTVTEVGTTTRIRGDARGETVIVKLYDEADTLVRVVTVMTTEPPHTYVWNGQTITYLGSGEPTNENNTNLVFTFTSTDGILELPEEAIADVLVVGGGGSGVAGNRDTGKGSSYYYRGNGGGGGKANEEDGVTLEVGVYTVCAGAGGAESVKPTTESGSSTRGQAGNAGNESSIAGGSFSLTAEGGAAGSGIASVYDGQTPEAGRFGANYTTSISGASVTYGQNGEGAANTQGQAGAAGAAGTGNGGQGGYYANGGKGGNGVVIVRLKGFVETPILAEPIVGTPKLNLGQPLSAITGWTGSLTNSTGKTVAGTFAWVTDPATVPTPAQSGLPVFEVVFTPNDTVFYRPAQYPAAIEFNIVPIAVPTAEKLTYNGGAQTGVVERTGYALTGNVATNAGSYEAWATLAPGYVWMDRTDHPTNIAWSIAKAQLGVTAVSTNKLFGAADPEFTATVTGLCGTDAFTDYEVGRTNMSNEVGTYDLVFLRGAAELDNYTVSYTNGLFEIRRGQITVIVNGQTKGFDDVDAAFDALADGGMATFNAVTEYDITEYAHMTIRRNSTLVVGEDGSWTFSGERGTSIEISEIPAEMNLTVVGTLCLFGDVFIGGIGADDTVVDVTTLLLDGEDIVVGQEDDGVDTTDAKAILAFESLVCQKPTKLILTENGVVRSMSETPLVIEDVFTAPSDDFHKILETPIEGGYEYTLIPLDVIDFPTVHEGLVYTGSEQRGVEDGAGYTLSGAAVATNAGTYLATATLDDPVRSVWEDLTTAPTNIMWTIAQRTTTIVRMPGATDLYTGQTLKGSELTNGLASVEGEFVWADTSVEPTNGLPYAVIFLPEDLVNNTTVTVEVTVVVHPQVAVPTAEKLTYNGGAQTGVVERTGYTLTGNIATNAGSYEAWATLAPGYVWTDRTDHPTNIAWSIAKAQLGVTAVSTNKLFGAADPKPFTATVTGLCGTDTFTDYSVDRTNTSEVVGTYDLVFLTGAAELDNYTVSYTNGLFEIRRGKVTVDGKDYDDLDAAFAALKDGSTMTFNEDVVHGGYGFPKAATLETANGTWAITGNLGVSNETAVATNLIVSGKLTLGADLTVGSDDAVALLKFAELEQPEDKKLTLTTNGTVRSTAQLEIADAFTAAEDLRRILETRDEDAGEWVYTLIVLTPIDVPTAVPGLVYDGGAKTGVVEDTGFTLTGNVATNAGDYTATATLVDPVRTVWIDRTDDPTNIAWTIAKATPGILAEPVHTELYDNDRLTNSVLKGEASVPGAFVWAEDDTTVPTNGQVCAVLFKPEDATNYEEVPMTVTVTVLHLVTVPTAVPGLVYNGHAQTGVFATVGFTLTGNVATNAGDYTAIATLDAGWVWKDDHATHATNIAWSIDRAWATVSAVSTNKLVGADDPKFTVTVTGTLGTDTVTNAISRTNADVETVGVYTGVIVPTGAAVQGNYNVTYTPGDFEIRAGQVTITVDDKTTGYDDIDAAIDEFEEHGGTAVLHCDLGGRQITLPENGIVQSGNQLTIADAFTAPEQYFRITETVTIADGWSYALTKLAPVAVPTAVDGLEYNGNGQTGVVERMGFTLTGNVATNVGTYEARATPADGYCWPDDTTHQTNVAWAIGLRHATVTAVSTNKFFGTEEPVFTTEVEGFVNSDDVELTWTVWRTNLSEEVGTYDLIVSGKVQQASYVITYVNGTFEICAGKMSVTTNGVTRGYDDFDAALAAMTAAHGGTAYFNEDVTVGGSTFAKGSTLTVNPDGSWSTDGTLTLDDDLYVPCEVAASNVVLEADITVGVWTGETATAEQAILSFKEIDLDDFRLTLTTNGVIRSMSVEPLVDTNDLTSVTNVFDVPPAHEIVERKITGGYEYTLRMVGYILTFDSKGGSEVDPIVAVCGAEVKKPEDPTKTGYGFAGWTTNDVPVIWPLTMPAENLTLTAKWTANTYKVAYDPNGGEGASVTNDATYDVAFAFANNPGFAKTGYSFGGWTTNLSSAVRFQPGDSVSNLTAEADATVTMYATWMPNNYKVEYNPNGGTGDPATSNATYDAEFTVAGQPFVKEGYTFESWTNAEGAVFAIGGKATNLTATAGATVKLYAEWEPNGYTLTYKPGEGTGDDLVSNMVYDVWYEVADCTFAKTGYSFREWTNEVGTAYQPGDPIRNLTDEPDGNVDFTVVWTANVYTVTYDANNGTGMSATSNSTYDVEFAIAGNPGFAKTGYSFNSWTNAEGEVFAFDAKAKNLVESGNATLYAKWTPNAYTVKYDPNGGDGEAATSNATYDVEFAISDNPGFTKTGYTFGSWTNAAGEVFLIGAPATNLTTSGEVALYAAWEPNAYTLVYTAGEGEGEDVETNLVYDVEHTVIGKPDDFAKTGYSFANWTNAEGNAYLPGDVVVNLTNEPNAVVTWTAVWTANVYTVTYDANGGEGGTATSNATYDVEFAIAGNPGFAKTGYSFNSWTNAEGVVFAFSAKTTNLVESGNVTLYAAWTPNAYKVKYDPNSGDGEAATSNATYDVEFTVAGQLFTKEGYTFNSWTNAEGEVFLVGGKATNLTAVKDATVTLYAAWTPNGYTLVYTAGEGEGEDVETNLVYDVEHTVIGKPDDFAKTGYSFENWTDEDGKTYLPGEIVSNLTSVVDGNVDFTAVWTANVYQVTYDANGGTGEPATSNATYDVEFAISDNPGFTKTGYTFGSWTNAEGEVFAIGVPAKNLSTGEAVTLYAAWTPNTYRLVCTVGKGTGTPVTNACTYDVEYTVPGKPDVFAKTGYSFTGWADGEDAVVTHLPGETFSNLTNEPNAVVTWAAVWTANVYAVTFDPNGGSEVTPNPIVASCDDPISAPTAPTRKWYGFAGWFDGDDEFTFPTTMPAGGAALTAKWDAKQGAPENPWKVGPEDDPDAVKAYVDQELGTVVLELHGTNELDLVALTNGLVQAGEEKMVGSTNFNAVVKKTDAEGKDVFMTPAGWLDADDPNEFVKTLAEALEDGLTSVLVCEDEPPAKIVEKAKTETGDIVTATVENDPGAVPNAIQASAVKGLIEIAEDKKENVRFSVEAKTEDEVKSGDVEKLLSIVESVEGLVDYRANYVDLSVFIGERQVDELDKVIDIYIPWTFDSRYSGYKMSCIHGDSVEEIPFGAPVSDGSEYFEKAADGRGFILHMSKFCDCLLAEIEASSSITTVMDDGTVIEIDVSKGIYDFKPPTKQGYLLSLTGNDGQPVVAGAPVRSGVVSVTAEWVRRVLWEKSEGVIIDNPYNVTAASVWDGYVVDAAGLTRGTIQLKVAKPNKKTGISKVTATVLLTGEKKVSIKGETADGRMTVTDKTGRVLDIVLSESAVAGTYGGMEIDGSRNMFTAKDAVSKSRADDAYARWQGAYVVVLEDADGCYGGVTLTVAKKGKIKVSGALADGTKVSGNTQLLIGERNCACAFSYTKKDVSTSFLVWFCTDGTVEISNLSEGGQGAAIARHATGAALEANAVCQISAESIVSAFGGGVNTEVLPNGTPVWQEGTKWKVAKAGKVAYKNGAWTYTGDNLAGVKLTYTAKTGVFKGSFTVYNLVSGKLKKIKVTVNGVMLDGRGYGTATVKKPIFKCPIMIGTIENSK